jgi:hypothetical protein
MTTSPPPPTQTELIMACWHSVIETQFGGQHNCLFSVVSSSSVAQNRIQAYKMNRPLALLTECFGQEEHAVVAVQPRVFSNSAADSGKMSTACVTCLTSEARATLMQHRKLLGSQNRLQNYWLFRNLYNDSVVLNLSTDTRQSVVVLSIRVRCTNIVWQNFMNTANFIIHRYKIRLKSTTSASKL